jgi:hypothetical protein
VSHWVAWVAHWVAHPLAAPHWVAHPLAAPHWVAHPLAAPHWVAHWVAWVAHPLAAPHWVAHSLAVRPLEDNSLRPLEDNSLIGVSPVEVDGLAVGGFATQHLLALGSRGRLIRLIQEVLLGGDSDSAPELP